tara:strand:+ start:963 stop:2006 length:1044 start_codon:yes stop_codon:yes gene_type:complete
MKKNTDNIAINFRHSAIGELLWMLPIIRSISIYNKKKIILFTRKENSAKFLLENEDYIKEIVYLPFRKGFYQFTDILEQANIFRKKNIKKLYVLEEIVRPLISGKIAGVKEMFAFGSRKQQKYLYQKKFLNKSIYKKHEFIRGKKFLELLSIKYVGFSKNYPFVNIKKKKFYKKKYKKFKNLIFLGVDAAEDFRTWPINYFVDLVNLIMKNYNNSFFFLVSYNKNKDKVFKIQKFLKKKYKKNNSLSLIKHNMLNIKYYLSISDIFIGNDSGPANLSDSLGVKTFCIYGATAPPPNENKIIKIFHKNKKKRYTKSENIVREYQKKNSFMNDIYPLDVYNRIKSSLRK